MLKFDPENPFPLCDENSRSYKEAQAHSERVDQHLGLATAEIEHQVKDHENQQLWVGLPVQSLLTPYTELRAILHRINPDDGETVVDLGAAYGRLGFVMARHFSKVKFIGIELDAGRVKEGRRCMELAGTPPEIRLEQGDLTDRDFQIPHAKYYFIYDFGSRQAVDKTLFDLQSIARLRPITVAARGGRSRDLIEKRHPWLSQVVLPEHFDHYSIYRSN